MTVTAEREEQRVRALLDRADTLESVAAAIEDSHPREAQKLLEVSRSVLDDAAPVPVGVAAAMLAVSDTTVRSWVGKGLLTTGRETRRLDPARLHEVRSLARDIRSAGRARNLRDELWHRLEDAALLERGDLGESLSQMRSGQLIPARTLDEKLAGGRLR